MAWMPTLNTLRVSTIFVASTSEKRCCADVSRALDLPVTTAHDTLRAMHKAGWLAFELEEINSSLSKKGPPRCFYRITEFGLSAAIGALNSVQTDRRAI